MYELTCPRCQWKTRSPFIRVGAVAECERCKHRWQIAPRHLRRDAVWGPGVSESAAPVAGADLAVRSKSSDVSPTEALGTERTADLPALGTESATPYQSASAPSRGMPLGGKVVIGLIAVTLVAVTAALGVRVLLGSGGQVDPATPVTPTTLRDLIGPDAPILEVDRIDASAWRGGGNAPPPRDPAEDPIQLELESSSPTKGILIRLAPREDEVVVDGLLDIIVLDDRRDPLSWRSAPVAVLSSRSSYRLWLSPPPGPQRPDRLVWRTREARVAPQSWYFRNIETRRHGSGEGAAVEVIATNPADETLPGAIFVIRVATAQGETLTRWKIRWPEPIDVGGRIHFAVITPVDPDWGAVSWSIEGVGAPLAEGDP